MKIKICGLRRREDILYVNQYNPDYIGFVFAKNSRRRVSLDEAVLLRKNLHRGIIPVGVFVNEGIGQIVRCVKEGAIDMVQLHGNEDNTCIEELRSLLPGTKIIKALSVSGKEDIYRGREMAADYLLFDTYHPNQMGGTGKSFDWSLLQVLEEWDKPYFLAGGINPDNIKEAMKAGEKLKKLPYAFDVSSGVETQGYKDRKKIARLMAEMKQQ